MACGRKHNGLTGKVSLNTDDRVIAELNKETFFFYVIFLSNHKLYTFEKYSHFWSPRYFQVQPLILSSSDGDPAKNMAGI